MPSVVNDPIDPRQAGAELHVDSAHGTRVNEKKDVFAFQSNQTISPEDDTVFARIAMTKFCFTHGMFNLTGDQCVIEFTEVYRSSSLTYPAIPEPVGNVSLTIPEGFYTDELLINTVNQTIRSFFESRGWDASTFGPYDYELSQGRYPSVDNLTGTQICLNSNPSTNRNYQFMRYRYPVDDNNYAYTIELPVSSVFWYNVLNMPTTPNEIIYASVFNYFPGVNDSYVSTKPPTWQQSTHNIYVGIDSIPCQVITTHPSQPNIIGRVPITVNFGEKQSWQEIDAFFVEVRNPVITGFTISLLDDNMQPIYNHGQPWDLSFYIDFVNVKHPYETMSGEDAMHTPYTSDNPLFTGDRLLRRKDFLRHR